ncbi:MAG: hypothetical protein HQM12_19940, partial [SAR324 cluster bacterium]|nr:hypothetical protein [SAR324 cluster bacterium]
MVSLIIKMVVFIGIVIGLGIWSEPHVAVSGWIRYLGSFGATILLFYLYGKISSIFIKQKPAFHSSEASAIPEIEAPSQAETETTMVESVEAGDAPPQPPKKTRMPTIYYITPLPTDIAEQILIALDHIRQNPREKINTDELLDAIMDVTESSVGEIVIMITDLIHASNIARKLLSSGIGTILSITRKTGKKVFKDLSHEQLMLIVRWAEDILKVADMDFDAVLPIKLNASYMSAMPLDRQLSNKSIELLQAILENPIEGYYSKVTVDVAMQIVEEVCQFYVVKPTEMMGVGAFARKIIDFAIGISLKVSRPALEKIFDSMAKEDMLVAANA